MLEVYGGHAKNCNKPRMYYKLIGDVDCYVCPVCGLTIRRKDIMYYYIERTDWARNEILDSEVMVDPDVTDRRNRMGRAKRHFGEYLSLDGIVIKC